jgi:hypothetical protein
MGLSLKSLNPVKIVSTIVNPVQSLVNSAVGTVNQKLGDALDVANAVQGTVGGLVGAALLAPGIAAGAGVAGAADAASGGASAAAAESSAAAAASSLSIISSIKDTVSTLKDVVGGIVGPIADTVHSITGVVTDINEGLIKPIVGPINEIMTAYKALNEGLVRDLHSGIGGLLKIPDDIANAMGSLDATMQRTVSMLGAANQKVIHDELGPGVGAGVIEGSEHVAASINNGLDAHNADERDAFVKTINEDPTLEMTQALVDKFLAFFNDNVPLVGRAAGALFDGVMSGWLVIAYLEAKKEYFAQEGRVKWPTELLGAGEVLQAMRRGILADDVGRGQLARLGFNPDRIQVLVDLDRKLPDEGTVLDWYHRGLVDQEQANNVLLALGWRGDDADRLVASSIRLPDIASSLDMYHRDLLTQDELDTELGAAGFRQVDRDRIIAASYKLAGPADLFAYLDRLPLISAQVAPQSIREQPDEAVFLALRPTGLSRDAIAKLWVNHYTLLPPPLATTAYFRGYINRPQLDALLSAAGLVPEQWQNYIDLQRPILPARSVPAYLAAGVINEQRAVDILRHNGYSDADVNAVIALGKSHIKAPQVATTTQLHGATYAMVEQLYDAGTLTREQANGLLVRLGMEQEAVGLALTLIDVRHAAAERKAHTEMIVTQVQLGKLSFDDAQGQLAQLGLTAVETARALAQIQRATQVKHKLPSEPQIMDMYQVGILTRADALSTLGLLGYDAAWSERLVTLQEKKHGVPTPSQ